MDEFNGRTYESGSRGGMGVMLFAVGACVGAAVALMLAPATGTETRAYLGRRGKDIADRSKDLANRGREIADDVTERGKKLWNEHGDRVVSAVQRGYEQATAAVSDRVNGPADTGQPM